MSEPITRMRLMIETAKMLVDSGNYFYNDNTREAVYICNNTFVGNGVPGKLLKKYMPKIESEMKERTEALARASDLLQKVIDILLTATIIGTSAAFAWLIASIVCGIIPSSAATTKMAISVAFAPLALISVNAS